MNDKDILNILVNICEQNGKTKERTIMKEYDTTASNTITCKVFMNIGLLREDSEDMPGPEEYNMPEPDEYEITIEQIWGYMIIVKDSSENIITHGYYDNEWYQNITDGLYITKGLNSGEYMMHVIMRLLVEGDFTGKCGGIQEEE